MPGDTTLAELHRDLAAEQALGYPTEREAALLDRVDATLVATGGDVRERLTVLDRLFKVRTAIGSGRDELAGTARRLGDVHAALDGPGTAESWYRRAVELTGDEDAKQAMGALLRQRHLIGKAYELEVGRAAMAVAAGSDEVSVNLVALARQHEEKGELAMAFACLVRALVIKEDDFGPDHWDTASRLDDLAEFLERRERRDEALAVRWRALDVYEQTDDSRRFVAFEHQHLARLAVAMGRPEDAEDHWRAAVATLEAVAPDDRGAALTLADIRYHYAEWLYQQKRYSDSVAEMRLVAEFRREDGSPLAYARALVSIGLIERDQGHKEAAIAAFEELARVQQEAYGPDHDDVRWAHAKIEEIRADGVPSAAG